MFISGYIVQNREGYRDLHAYTCSVFHKQHFSFWMDNAVGMLRQISQFGWICVYNDTILLFEDDSCLKTHAIHN